VKLDYDLVRAILLTAQTAPPNREVGEIVLDPWTADAIREHVEALDDGGLIEARLVYNHESGNRLIAARVIRVTWEGHEFLGRAANAQVWTRVSALVAAHGGNASMGILKELLSRAAVCHFRS
jgi:uncharacterized protein DUF2513